VAHHKIDEQKRQLRTQAAMIRQLQKVVQRPFAQCKGKSLPTKHFLQHLRNVHGASERGVADERTRLLRCKLCEFEAGDEEDFDAHMDNAQQTKAVNCLKCENRTSVSHGEGQPTFRRRPYNYLRKVLESRLKPKARLLDQWVPTLTKGFTDLEALQSLRMYIASSL
jgi:hypothetical protein